MGRPRILKVNVVDGRGLGGKKRKTVTVQTRIPDIRVFRDLPIFAYLLLAANPDVSIPVLREVLKAAGPHQDHPKKWMYERRQLVLKPSIPHGVDDRAVSFVAANMTLPAWNIRKQLRQRGIDVSTPKISRIRMAIQYASVMASSH